MPAIELAAAQRSEHRAAAQRLRPVVLIGAEGLTPAVLHEADQALNAHGLIKIRVASDDRAARAGLLSRLADALNAAPIQHIGKLLVLWRALPEKERSPRDDRLPGPKVVKVLKFSKSGNHRPQVKRVTVLGNQRLAAGGTLKRVRKRVASAKKRAGA